MRTIILALSLFTALGTDDEQNTAKQQPAKGQAALVNVAAVDIGREQWEFTPNPKGSGVLVSITDPTGNKQFVIDADGKLGTVVDLAVGRIHLWHGGKIIGLGVAHVPEGEDVIEYRMLVGRSDTDYRNPDRWSYSMPLISREPDDPFDSMAIYLPGGDSVALTLTELERVEGDDKQFVIHTFVDDCPLTPRMSFVRHFRSVLGPMRGKVLPRETDGSGEAGRSQAAE